MRVEQCSWREDSGWQSKAEEALGEQAALVLLFGSTEQLERPEPRRQLRERYPKARLVGCSTAGEIAGTRVSDDSLVATALSFAGTTLRLACRHLDSAKESQAQGVALARALQAPGLQYVLVLSDGLHVNGSELVAGLREALPPGVSVSGGLAGDGSRFQRTLVLADEELASQMIVAVGFYGARLVVGHGSLGGWDGFGPTRRITRSVGNVLYELDGQSALTLYKRYLGPHVDELPSSALRFPLALLQGREEGEIGVVRTVLAIDEAQQSMTFAGDMPEGSAVQLMTSGFDKLIDGAIGAAQATLSGNPAGSASLGLLISCVGRKLVLQQRTEEEVEGVQDVLGPQAVLTGFYSYGEISPHIQSGACELHNQSMTITTLSEED